MNQQQVRRRQPLWREPLSAGNCRTASLGCGIIEFFAAIVLLACTSATDVLAQDDASISRHVQSINFDDWFTSGALRLELVQSGDTSGSVVSLQEIYAEPIWAENPAMLNMPMDYGRLRCRFVDLQTGTLICTRRFDTMFGEYVTTEPARKGIKRAYELTVRCPTPKHPVKVILEDRDRKNNFHPIFETTIDPTDYHIRRDSIESNDVTFVIEDRGDPQHNVDIVFLAEGYTEEDLPEFRADVRKMADFLLSQRPYSELKDRISIRGVFRASQEQGTDQPRQNSYRSTVLNSSYNIFDLDRYLLVEDNHAMHRMAAQVPYDTIVVLVNTERYGGGGICLDYCVCAADNALSPITFLHEFGHSFANLADEYVGNVAYSDMYAEGIEPYEPNITRELDPTRIKWKKHLTPGVPLPTPVMDADKARELQIVGAFEGGGYLKEGMYRPEQACWMGSNDRKEGFCVVCQEAIRTMIELQTGTHSGRE